MIRRRVERLPVRDRIVFALVLIQCRIGRETVAIESDRRKIFRISGKGETGGDERRGQIRCPEWRWRRIRLTGAARPAILEKALVIARKDFEIIRLARMPESVRSTGRSDRIGRPVRELRAFARERVEIRRLRRTDDLAVGMIFHDHDDNVIRTRQRLHFRSRGARDYGQREKYSASYHFNLLQLIQDLACQRSWRD